MPDNPHAEDEMAPFCPPHKPSERCVDTCDNPSVCREEWDAWQVTQQPAVEQTDSMQDVDRQIAASREGYELAVTRFAELADLVDDWVGEKMRLAVKLVRGMAP